MEPTLGHCWSWEPLKSRENSNPVGNTFSLLLSSGSTLFPLVRLSGEWVLVGLAFCLRPPLVGMLMKTNSPKDEKPGVPVVAQW